MHFQTVVMNVADLQRSVEFYGDVFGFTVLTQGDQLAVINAPASEAPQVIVLRAFGTSGRVGGGRHVGMRALMMEVDSVDELEQIATRLDARGALAGRAHGEDWTSVVGTDPDHLAVVMNCSLGDGPITTGHWLHLSEVIYQVGE